MSGDESGMDETAGRPVSNNIDPDSSEAESVETSTERLHSMGYSVDGEGGTDEGPGDSTGSGLKTDVYRVLILLLAVLVALALLAWTVQGFANIWLG